MSDFRTLTFIEENERNYKKREQDALKRYCIENYGYIIKANNTARSNSIRIIGDKNNKECNKKAFYDITSHDKPSIDI